MRTRIAFHQDVQPQVRFPRGVNPTSQLASDPAIVQLAPMLVYSPMGPSAYDRPQLRLVYRAARLNEGARDLYVPDDPRLFFKPISALVGPDDPIVAPPASMHVECEAALAAVIKRRCRNVPAARVREYVLGYAGLNDVTAHDLQARDGDWRRSRWRTSSRASRRS